jgi:hypothetical protein
MSRFVVQFSGSSAPSIASTSTGARIPGVLILLGRSSLDSARG